MKTLVILTALVCGSVGNILQNKFEKRLLDKKLAAGTKDPKLIGGHQADWSQFPFIVAITNTTYFQETGTIIAENFVITHYFAGSHIDTSVMKVRHGSIEKNVAEVIFTKKDVEFGSDGIALLKLEDKFDLSGPNIKSIALPNGPVPLGTNCTVVGVGARVNQDPGDKLQYISVPIVSNDECEAYWNDPAYFPTTNLTFGDDYVCSVDNEANDTCYTLRGDALVCDGALTGLTTILSLCEEKGSKAVYVSVAYYKQWIEDRLNGVTTTTSTTTSTSTTTTSTTEGHDTTTPAAAAVNCLSVPVAVVSLLLTIKFNFKFR